MSFDETRDLYIKSEFYGGSGEYRPLEFAGTGFLHVLQVFSYLVLFRPSLLLIDEPESHLHPTLQTRLTRELRKRVSEIGSSALITTHSPFVARALPMGSNVVWVKSGGITESKESELIKRLLGWGALDKPILICTEDSSANNLIELLKQAPELDNAVSVFPFNGVSTLGHGAIISELKKKLGDSHVVLVHRDRDGLTDEEIEPWEQEYRNHGIIPWVTQGTDIESYFCDAGYISSIYGITYKEASELIDEVLDDNIDSFLRSFSHKRSEINRRYAQTGGSPITDELLSEWPFYKWVKGKDLIGKIRGKIRQRSIGDEKLIGRSDENYYIATDLIKIVRSSFQ